MSPSLQMRAVGPEADLVAGHSARAFAPHSHEQYGFGLVLAGGQRSRSRSGIVEARRGDLINVLPGEIHDGAPLDASGRAWTMLYLDAPLMERLLLDVSGARQRAASFAGPVLSDPAAVRQLQRVLACAAHPHMPPAAFEEALLPLLACLVRDVDRVPPCSDAVRRVRARLDEAPELPHSLDALAAEGQIGKFHLIRSFAAVTGLTPHAYLVQARLGLARRLSDAG
ncbi:AraC family transcriptional regulator, partial [Massilia arenosa]